MTRGRSLAVALGLAVVVAALHARVLLAGMTFGLRDHLVLDLPIRTFLHEALRAGRIPQWWDGVGAGVAFAASPVHQVWAPVTWLCALLPMPFGAALEPLVYLWIAATGTALLAARLGAGGMGTFLAGAVVATSGYLNSLVPNGNLPYVAWVPWIAWGTARLVDAVRDGGRVVSAAALLAALAALQLVVAEPASTVTALVLAVAVALARGARVRALALAAAAGVGGLALAAVQVLPAARVLGASDRAGGFDLAVAGEWSLHPARLVELAWPRVLGDAVRPELNAGSLLAMPGTAGQDPSWSFSVFLGVPVLVLAVAAARRRLALPLAAAVLLLAVALGTHTPLFELFRQVFPPERLARYPEKHVLGATIIAAALAGVALGAVRAQPRRHAAALGAAGVVLGSAVAVLVVLQDAVAARLVASPGGAALDGARVVAVSITWGAVACAAALAAAGGALLAGARGPLQRAGEGLIVAAVIVPAAANVHALTGLVPRAEVAAPPALLRLPPGDAAYRERLYRPRVTTEPTTWGVAATLVSHETAAINTASRFGLQVIPGHDAAVDREWVAFWDEAHRRLSPWELGVLLGARWVAVDVFAALPPFPGPVVAEARRLRLVDFPAARPRGFVTSRVVPAPSREQAIAALSAPGRARDPSLVVLESAAVPRGAPGPAGPPRPCLVRAAAPEEVELLCDAPAAGYAVLLDAHAEGWSATVDGRAAEIVRADGFFRAVALTPGSHRIRFSYSTPGLGTGAVVSLLAALLALAGVVAERRLRRRASAVVG